MTQTYKGERLWAVDCAILGVIVGFLIGAVFGVPLAESGITAPFRAVGSIFAAFEGVPFLEGAFSTAAMGGALGLVVGWVTAEFAEPVECDETVSELLKKTYL